MNLSFASALACVLLGASAHASDNSAAADALFRAGRQAMDTKDYELACARFKESLNLEHTVGTRLNLANCEELRGNVATAWQHFDAAKRGLPPEDPRYKVATERADALEARLPKLEIRLSPAAPKNVTVKKGETTFTQSAFELPLPVDPGKFTLLVEAPGHEPKTFEVDLAEGATQVVEVAPGPAIPTKVEDKSPAPEAPVPQDEPEPAPESSGPSPLAYVFGGFGVAALGAAAYFQLKGSSDEQELLDTCGGTAEEGGTCNVADVDAVDLHYGLATASAIVGVAALGAGAYFFFFTGGDSRDEARRGAPSTALGVTPTLGGAAISVSQTF